MARLLLQLFRRNLTGRLAVVDDKTARSAVFFRNGIPIFVERPDQADRLDRVLLDQGKLDPDQVAEAERKRAETGKKLGEVLTELGFLDQPSLASLLRVQTTRKLSRLVRLDRGVFEVFVHDHGFGLGQEFEELTVQPVRVVYATIRESYSSDRLMRETESLAGQIMSLKTNPPMPLAEMGFLFSQQPILEGLRSGGIGFDELRDAELISPRLLAGLLVFLYGDMLDLKPSAHASAASASAPLEVVMVAEPADRPAPEPVADAVAVKAPPATPSRGTSATPFTRRMAAVTEEPVRVTARPGTSPGQRSVAMSASAGAASAPARTSSSVPRQTGSISAVRTGASPPVEDQTPGAEAAAEWAAPQTTSGFGSAPRTSGGFDTPSPSRVTGMFPSGVTRAVQLPPPGAPMPSDAGRRKTEADMNFKRAEMLLKHGDFAHAEPHFQRAVELMPDDLEYQSLTFWTKFMNPKTEDRAKAAQDGLTGLAAILKAQPKYARARYFVGMMFKHLGDMEKAERAFAAALKEDPTLLDAERELRLIAIRRPQPTKTIFGLKVK